jgi:nucleotide-binding universal stress UspA family protein
MKTVNKIMVAVDFSGYSLAAADYAAKLAVDMGTKILLTHVYNKRDVDLLNMVATRVPEFSVRKYVNEHINERKKRLLELQATYAQKKLVVETSVRIGVPYDALLQEIEEKKPDLLIMGAKGRSNVMDMIIGSCA